MKNVFISKISKIRVQKIYYYDCWIFKLKTATAPEASG